MTGRWFSETPLPLGRTGIEIRIAVDRIVHEERSDFGEIVVLDTPFYGRVLVIDGIVQTTTSDEFVYHEMIVTLPLVLHGDVRSVLVIGGGDGGALRQAARSPRVERIVQVEIDDAVTRVSRAHLPEVSGGAFDDPRVELVFADGARFLGETAESFDLIVLDLTDPVPGGPAEGLFEADALASARARLAPGGIVAMQCGSLIFQPDEVAQQDARVRAVFDGHADLRTAVVPGYQLTTFGFLLGAVEGVPRPSAAELHDRLDALDGPSEYLSAAVIAASAALPPYLARRIGRDSD